MREVVFGLNLRKVKARLFILNFLNIRNAAGVVLLFWSLLSHAQTTSIRCLKVAYTPQINLDSVFVDPNSLTVQPQVEFIFEEESNSILLDSIPLSDSLEICFRTLPQEILQPFSHRSIKTYSYLKSQDVRPTYEKTAIEKPNIFQFNNVDMVGAISRGISIGNNQDLVVNSALNLQIDGKMSDNLFVKANITDQNIPFQPEGNTQQIRDFDNVYIELFGESYSLAIGDLVSKNTNSNGYFLKYNKNVQGIQGNLDYQVAGWKAQTTGLLSIAKGQFASTVVEPIEGIQGPYRLRGANNERFIIIMANSEKVYVDGQLLSRGFDRDYTIDYNQSEITFSNQILITRFSRIRVDYEYADQFYGRTNLNLAHEMSLEKSTVYMNFYQEKDNTNNPFGFEQDAQNLQRLAATGDNLAGALVSGIDSVGRIENAILYVQKDTITDDGASFLIYEYQASSEDAIYQISFSEVNFGEGDYVLNATTSNGSIYQWVSPQNGISQGNFIPEINVQTPNLKQMFVIGGVHHLSKYEHIYSELAIANQDLNLYSDIDDNDNHGQAVLIGFKSTGRNMGNDYQLTSEISYEHNTKNFRPIDRFRTIEYDRNWSYNSLVDSIAREDNILKFVVKAQKNRQKSIEYQFSARSRDEVVDGSQHAITISQKLGLLVLSSQNSLLNTGNYNAEAQWVQSSSQILMDRWIVQPGYRYTVDRHKLVTQDSVISSLMNFEAHNLFLKTNDTLKVTSRIDFTKRRDRLPINGELDAYTEAEEIKISAATSDFENHRINVSFTYRNVYDHLLRKSDKNVLGILSWNSTFFDRVFTSTLQYGTANSRELKRAFVFIQVPIGQGTHTWRDENGDGIQDINEFYEAVNIDEREYAKIFTPTDEYINAFQTTYLHTLGLVAPKDWRKSNSAFIKKLAKVSLNAHLNINAKSTDDTFRRLNPFFVSAEDTSTIFLRSSRRYSAFYNRNSAGLGLDISVLQNDNKSLLSNGFEIRNKEDYQTNLRIPLMSKVILRLNMHAGEIVSSSDFLFSRNYRLDYSGIGPTVIWQPSNEFRISTNYSFDNKISEDTEEDQFSKIVKVGANVNWINVGKGNLTFNFEWVSIKFAGEEQSALGYELLEALRPGDNQKWGVNWQQNVRSGLQLSLSYNGRNSQDQRVIHTGNMSLTAFF